MAYTFQDHRKEARAKGIKLVGDCDCTPPKRGYKHYSFKCGHTNCLEAKSVAKVGRVHQCQHPDCLPKGPKQLKKLGLELIGPCDCKPAKKYYKHYKIIECGHQICRQVVTKDIKPKCDICAHDHKKEALKKGLILLGPCDCIPRKKNSKHYKFKKCGHEVCKSIQSIRTHNPKCDVCYEISLARDAQKTGLQVLRPGRTTHSRWCKIITCNHEKEINVQNIRNGKFNCEKCQEIRLLKFFLPLLVNIFRFLKVL